jgi:hypothetical protein
MRAIGKAIVVVAVLGLMGCNGVTEPEEEDTGDASRDLRSAIVESEMLNQDAQVTVDVSLADARNNNLIGGGPNGVIVEPEHCLTYLGSTLEEQGEPAGWLQMGVRPEGQSHFSALVASLPGGVTPDDLRGRIRDCESGTMILENIGVRGTFSITEVEVPEVDGAMTLGLRAITSFPRDITEDELARALSCAARSEQLVTDASQACGAEREVTAQEVAAVQQVMSFYSNEYHFVYVMSENVLVESCEVQMGTAFEVASQIFERATR